ncbi:MAG: hypothetical protein JXN62_13265 [Bacteroidales bacterium]|nr:hypothetical protein [Bacteroidales bacterium]
MVIAGTGFCFRNDVEAARKIMDRGEKLNCIPGARLYQAIMKRRYEMTELLLSKGIRLSSRQKLAECLVEADERMKEIIKKYSYIMKL